MCHFPSYWCYLLLSTCSFWLLSCVVWVCVFVLYLALPEKCSLRIWWTPSAESQEQVSDISGHGWVMYAMARAQKSSAPVMLPAFPFCLQSLTLWPGWDWSIETGNQGVGNLHVLCSRSDVWPGTGEVFWLVNPDEGNFTGFAGHCIC